MINKCVIQNFIKYSFLIIGLIIVATFIIGLLSWLVGELGLVIVCMFVLMIMIYGIAKDECKL